MHGHAISYGELNRTIDAFADQLGVAMAEPVVLLMNSCLQYVMTHFNIEQLGIAA